MTWNMADQSAEQTQPTAVINLKVLFLVYGINFYPCNTFLDVKLCFLQLHSDAQPDAGERDVKFQLAKDTMEMMLKSMYCIKDQLSEPVSVTVLLLQFPFYCLYSWPMYYPRLLFLCQGETPDKHIVQNSNAV